MLVWHVAQGWGSREEGQVEVIRKGWGTARETCPGIRSHIYKVPSPMTS